MSTLELKSIRDGPIETKARTKEPKKTTAKESRVNAAVHVPPVALTSKVTNRVTSDLAFDLESLRHKMDSILNRASHVASQEEDEADGKMRRLLEEIYAVPSLTEEEQSLREDWDTVIGEEGRLWGEEDGQETAERALLTSDGWDLDQLSGSETKETRRPSVRSETKGIF
jgi:hypothetical protein